MAKRPITQREITKAKNSSLAYVTLCNKTTNQPVSIQLRAPNGVDFYIGEQTVILHCGKTGKFPVSRLIREQIVNHQKAGRISIVSGSLE
jgi:hypothetical protein